VTVNSAAATPLHSVVAAATFRAWAVGVRINIVATTALAGNNVLFQLARPGNSSDGTTATLLPVPHDFSAPASLLTNFTAWTTPPTLGVVVGEWELPFTSGSSWEEFPPTGYEWQIPAIADAAANNGLHMFVTCSTAVSTTFTSDIICSY
jgi:hypothetical protein